MTNYEKGANKERRIVNLFRSKDCIAFRSAGSHSPIDVVVIDYLHGEIKLIQAKTGRKLTKPVKDAILDSGHSLDGLYSVTFELWDQRLHR